MTIKIQEKENGVKIYVKTEKKVALAVYNNGEERIYLPTEASSDSTYYVENKDTLTPTEQGYTIKIEEKPEKAVLLD